MKTIGLVGGSGAGKGYVCKIFAAHGIPALDTDLVYRRLTEPGQPCLAALCEAFGEDILARDGSLDRKKLASMVFGDAALLKKLNGITHRYVLERCRLWLKEKEAEGYPAAIIDAPALYESGFDAECDTVVAMVAPSGTRIRRIMERDGIDRAAAEKRIAAQIPEAELRRRADTVIENADGDDTEAQVMKLVQNFKKSNTETDKGEEIMSEIKNKKEELLFKAKTIYGSCDEAEQKKICAYAVGYKAYLDAAKTEREAVEEGIKLAEAQGYRPYTLGQAVKTGDKLYYNNRGKNLVAFVIGKKPIESGIRISAAHVDSPRVDLKQHPLYEEGGMGFLKTHYYGGIKKYQWTAIPLALHGVISKANGEEIKVVIGEDDCDPVFYINDLLPHLGKDQSAKPLSEGITGEQLNILVGSKPFDKGEESDEIKLQVMAILNEKYGITEGDFISAELSAVPAFKSRDVGFDRSLIGGYGHDDRVCAYPALTALFEAGEPEETCMAILADKEEIGSVGNTGMKCAVFMDIIDEISKSLGADPAVVRANSKCLSADVGAAFDPNFAEVYERNNSAFVNRGVVMVKFTGSRGKAGSSDANAEFVGEIRRLFDAAEVVWQTAELGKVDQGGGGTVAQFIAEKNIDVVDLGVAVISMHAPYEVISKGDLYMAHKAFLAFNTPEKY